MHFLVQLCEQSVPGIFWGHALPVPEFGELFKAGVKRQTHQPLFEPRARRVSSGRNSARATIWGRREVTYGLLLNRD